MAVAGISRTLLKVASKAAKKYIKENPGKSNIDALENLQKNFDFDFKLTRLKTDNTRNVTKRSASHEGEKLIKNIFTKNQLQKIKTEAQSATKIDQYKQGIMGTETHLKNLSNAQKRQIKESIETGIESKNPTVAKLVDLYNTGYSKPGEKTYIKAQDALAKELGVGSRKKLRNDPDFNEAFQKRRGEMQMLYHQGMTDDLTPAGDILTKYPRHGYEGVMDKRSALNEMAFGDELYPFLKNELNLSRSQIAAGMGHEYPIAQLAKIIAGGGRPDMSTLRAIQLASNPKNIKPELNFMNQAKNRGIENFLYSSNMSADKLNPLSNLMKNAQMSSKFYSPTGVRQQIGATADEIDPKQLLQFLKYIQKDQPYGLTKKGNSRYLPNQDYIKRLLRGEEKEFNFARGGKVDGYAAGGIGRIGIKLLAKLAKKLSPKEMKMLTGSAFKGTNPSKSLAKKREANLMKKLDGNYNRRNVKSKVPGPRSSVDRMNDKQYPYLDPDNDAFIVSGQSEHPVTGTPQLNKFGRYQLKSTINDTLGSDDSLFRKYSVYDWWDDITETIRERPKFKYVKDSKGNTIMKEVK